MYEHAVKQAEEKAGEVDLFISKHCVTIVKTQEEYNDATETCKKIREKARELEETRKSIVKPINDSVKKINDMFKPYIEKLTLFETGIKKTASKYIEEQERIRIEEQRKADEAARKERERIEEQARKQREKEEAARREAEAAALKAQQTQDTEERKRLEAEAEKKNRAAEAAAEKAEEKETISTMVVANKIEDSVQRQGLYFIEKWSVTVKNKKEFVLWVMQTGQLEYINVDEKLLNKEVQNTKGQRTWPGIQNSCSKTPRMRS